MSDYIPAALRELVATRAHGRCEYCHYPQRASFLSFEIEYIIARKHGGQSGEHNLALACPFCNNAKGSDIGSLDPDTDQLTPLFNPRRQQWEDHFRLEGPHIVPLTAIGRVTVNLLRFNHPDRLAERTLLIEAGLYPGDAPTGR